MLEKETLSLDVLEAQSAFELPKRDLMLITIVITNVLNNLSVEVDVSNVGVALQVCAVVQDINAILVDDDGDALAILTCEINQQPGPPSG